MKFDDVLQYVGEFGPYQIRIYLLLCLFCVAHGMRLVVMVFILNLPKHRCAIPGFLNDTYDVTSLDHERAFNMSIPSEDSCHIFVPGNYTYDLYNQPVNATLQKCDAWVYDTSVFTRTVATQFNLVCDDAAKRSHATMTFYGGFLIGVFVFGAISDIIGRKLCLYLSMTLLILLGMSLAFVNSFVMFAVLNFFVGASTSAIFSSAYVIGMEFVGPSKRTYAGMFIQLFFSTGVVGVDGLAFLIRDWQYLQIAITAPLVVFYAAWWLIPESPRWQIQRGRYSAARKTVEKLAKRNGTKVPVSLVDEIMPMEDPEKLLMIKQNGEDINGGAKKEEDKGRLADMFKSKVLFFRTMINFFSWTIVSLTFYGLIFNTANLGAGSLFLNFFFSGLVEYPAHLINIVIVNRLGRKVATCGMMIISGVSCLACVFSIIFAPEYKWLTITLAMLGKFGAAGGFGAIYMFSTELFPTVIRNSALGACSSFARLGAMLAPYIAAQGAKTGGTFGRGVPLLICGILILCSGLMSLLLPETLNRKLPETISDAKNFTKHSQKPDIMLPLPSPVTPHKNGSPIVRNSVV